jgi:hypothetical protein
VTLAPAPKLVSVANDSALVLITGAGTGQLLLREGKPLGTDATAIIKSFSILQPALGSPGHARWGGDTAVIAKVTLTTGEIRIVTIKPDATVTSLIATTFIPTDVSQDARWHSFGLPAIDPTGAKFALVATLRPLRGVVTAHDDSMLLAKRGTDYFTAIAREGDPISQASNAPAFASFFDPVIDDSGAVAFLATLQGSGVTGANKSALFVSQPGGELQLIARLGDHAPDETGAATSAVWTKFTSYALPSGSGAGLLFLAETRDANSRTKSEQALWAIDSQGTLRRLIRTNKLILNDRPAISALSLLTATPGSFGAARSYNATGSVALRATYLDRTQGLLRIDLP